ncbi:MAG TPA: hypothetical protein VF824_00975 [Thermoanaerobaculia bacterium]|jgi:hypothetical protein
MRRQYWIPVMLAAAALVVVKLQWAHGLGWDEVEFFRATRWLARGLMPYRDFWEHHLPLQWLLFAPVARFIDWPGVAAILLMRWAQLPLWIAAFALLWRLGAAAGVSAHGMLAALVALVASPLFLDTAIEFRVDTVAAAAFLGGLMAVLAAPRRAGAWIAFGFLMSAAVFANLRHAYVVVPTAVAVALIDYEERRWRFNVRSLWMSAGIAIAAVPLALWLVAGKAMQPFLEVMRLNVIIDRILGRSAHTLVPLLLRPFTTMDAAAIVLIGAGLIGFVLALRGLAAPGPLQLVALVTLFTAVSVGLLGVHYPYHLQMTLLMLVPLAGSLIRTEVAQRFGIVVAATLVAIAIATLTRSDAYAALRYQDRVMREADRRTRPDERVWDGVGYALRREPAYRYWFLSSIVRLGAQHRLLPPYDAAQIMQRPPAAIVHSMRVNLWLAQYPDAAAYVTRHYVPLDRDLWLPAMSGPLRAGHSASWIAPRAGRYRFIASELLMKHPWFYDPLKYGRSMGGEDADFSVDLRALPLAPRAAFALAIDGRAVDGDVFDVSAGASVALTSHLDRAVGVLIVPDDWTRVFVGPPAPVVM